MSTALQQFDALQHYVPLRAMIPTIGGGEYVLAADARKIIAQREAEIEKLKGGLKPKPLEWTCIGGETLETCQAASAYGVNHLYVVTRRAGGGWMLEIHHYGHFAGRVESSTVAGCDDYAQAHHRKEIAKFFETFTPEKESPPSEAP